jgi:hypothetical protein
MKISPIITQAQFQRLVDTNDPDGLLDVVANLALNSDASIDIAYSAIWNGTNSQLASTLSIDSELYVGEVIKHVTNNNASRIRPNYSQKVKKGDLIAIYGIFDAQPLYQKMLDLVNRFSNGMYAICSEFKVYTFNPLYQTSSNNIAPMLDYCIVGIGRSKYDSDIDYQFVDEWKNQFVMTDLYVKQVVFDSEFMQKSRFEILQMQLDELRQTIGEATKQLEAVRTRQIEIANMKRQIENEVM